MADWSGYTIPTNPRRIDIRVRDGLQIHEHIASGIFTPGHVLKRDTNDKVLKQSVAGAPSERLLANINILDQGKTIDDPVAVGDVAACIRPLPGDLVLLRIPAAAAAIVKGDALQVNGDGTVVKRVTTTYTIDAATGPDIVINIANATFAFSAQAVDNSAGGAEVWLLAYMH